MMFYFYISSIILSLVIVFMSINGSKDPYRFWTNDEIHDHLKRQMKIFGADKWVIKLVKEARENKAWIPTSNYDGCTIIQDKFHPCLACYIHDYLQRMGMGGWGTDSLFHKLLILQGVKKYKALVMWAFVRCGWILYYKWKHLFAGNVQKPSINLEYALSITKIKKR